MSLIHIENLCFTYPKQTQPTLQISNLQIQKGETVFVYGASGSGKTTFLEVLAGVLPAKTGQVEVLGQNLCGISAVQKDRFRADHIGYIFQSFNLIPYLNVLENILLPLSMSKKRQEKFQASELLQTLKILGIDQLEKRKVTELSIGQQQRVAVARALIGQPEIILADEPTSSLDYDHREKFLQVLFQSAAAAQSTVVFVSHDRSMEKLFHRVLSFAELNQVNAGGSQ